LEMIAIGLTELQYHLWWECLKNSLVPLLSLQEEGECWRPNSLMTVCTKKWDRGERERGSWKKMNNLLYTVSLFYFRLQRVNSKAIAFDKTFGFYWISILLKMLTHIILNKIYLVKYRFNYVHS
jgi:hypothetical protein